MTSRPRAVCLLSLTSPVTETTDSLGSFVMSSNREGSIFFLGRVICTVPYLSLRMRNEMPPMFLMSWTHPLTVALPSATDMLPESLTVAILTSACMQVIY